MLAARCGIPLGRLTADEVSRLKKMERILSGWVKAQPEAISAVVDAVKLARAGAAIRKNLRPELVNRLTKVVHFRRLGKETVRDILGKLLANLNTRLADRGVIVELDGSAEEQILREGFSEEYGARNLERVVDRMLGSLLAEELLGGVFAAGGTIRLHAVDGEIRICD